MRFAGLQLCWSFLITPALSISPRPLATAEPVAQQSLPANIHYATGQTARASSALDEAFGEIKIASEAVIIFFVLSGYLVGGSVLRSMRRNVWSWKEYLSKRLIRLYIVLIPALIIGVSIDLIGSHLFGAGSVYTTPHGIELVTTWHFTERFRAWVVLGNLAFLDGIYVPFIGTNVALWSLSNEFWYYAAFPMLVIAALGRVTIVRRIAWFVCACMVLLFVGWRVTVLFPVWIMGAIATVFPQTLSVKRARSASIVLGIILIVAMAAVRLLHWGAVPAYYLLGTITGVFIYAVAQQTQPSKKGIYRACSSLFSRISYTLYLFHVPLAVFLCGLINTPWHRWPKDPVHLLLYIGSDAFIVVCCYYLWVAFEARTDKIRTLLLRR